MNQKLKTIQFGGLLAALLVLLAACSTDSGSQAGPQPEIQLYLVTEGSPVRITSGALVGSSPVFELRIVDREEVETARYRVDGGSWHDLAGYGFHRTRFIPSAPFTGTGASLEVEATNRSGRTASYTAALRVDSIHPEITNLAYPVIPYTDVDGVDHRRVEISAQATDQGAASGRLEVHLELNGEIVHSTAGGLFNYTVEASQLPEGMYVYLLSAVDGAGNRSEVEVIPVRGGMY